MALEPCSLCKQESTPWGYLPRIGNICINCWEHNKDCPNFSFLLRKVIEVETIKINHIASEIEPCTICKEESIHSQYIKGIGHVCSDCSENFSHDIRAMLICTFRYSLGRQGYVVEECSDLIFKYAFLLDNYTKKQIIKDIEREHKIKALGSQFDEEVWLAIAAYLKKLINYRDACFINTNY